MKKSSRNLYSSSESLQYVAALVTAAGPRILELYRGSGSAALALRVFTPPGDLNNVGLNGFIHSLPSTVRRPTIADSCWLSPFCPPFRESVAGASHCQRYADPLTSEPRRYSLATWASHLGTLSASQIFSFLSLSPATVLLHSASSQPRHYRFSCRSLLYVC